MEVSRSTWVTFLESWVFGPTDIAENFSITQIILEIETEISIDTRYK
jgi:hypothetical protein